MSFGVRRLIQNIDRNDVCFVCGLALLWYGLPESGPWIVGLVLIALGLFGAVRKGV